jgi:FkbH-like protein
MPTFREAIRLVIWDLDETFWHGTLEEGAVTIPPEHADIVKALAQRGIVSSICSKNNFAAVQARLEKEGLWEWFVFPAIEYAFKSNLVKNIVEQMGLRPETVLLIDDNSFNRAEVADQVPGINVGDETLIAELLGHPQLKGKPDPDLTRLARYRVLQTKQQAIANSDAPAEFLRGCEIKISYHFDIGAEFGRIHELVNRTNQLNFTKLRWNEDIDIARAEYFAEAAKTHNSHAGYIKVRDRYGYYGICGFFENTHPPRFRHLLFSCRVLNMGVEQFVYQQFMFPGINVVEPVVAKLQKAEVVDWITVVADAEIDDIPVIEAKTRLCLHGPCELVQSAHYLRPYYRIIEEFQYPRDGWSIQRPLLRNLILADELRERGISTLEELGLPGDFPALDIGVLDSAFFTGGADFAVWSFSLEAEVSCYRHRATGLVMPLSLGGFDAQDLTAVPYETVLEKRAAHKRRAVKREHFEACHAAFEYFGRFDADQFRADLRKLRDKLLQTGKTLIVVDPFDDLDKIERGKYRSNAVTNRIVHEELEQSGVARFIGFADCVSGKEEEIGINHFHRGPYIRLADRIREVVGALSAQSAETPLAAHA